MKPNPIIPTVRDICRAWPSWRIRVCSGGKEMLCVWKVSGYFNRSSPWVSKLDLYRVKLMSKYRCISSWLCHSSISVIRNLWYYWDNTFILKRCSWNIILISGCHLRCFDKFLQSNKLMNNRIKSIYQRTGGWLYVYWLATHETSVTWHLDNWCTEK